MDDIVSRLKTAHDHIGRYDPYGAENEYAAVCRLAANEISRLRAVRAAPEAKEPNMDDLLQSAIDILADQLAAMDDDCGDADCDECNAVRRPIERALERLRLASIGVKAQAKTDNRPTWFIPHASTLRCLHAAIDRIYAGDDPAEVFDDYGWSLTPPDKPAETSNPDQTPAALTLRWPHDDMGRVVGEEG